MTVASLTVRGGARNSSSIASVRVNGVVATTNNGFAEWEAEVSLAMGANLVIVESEDADGEVDTVASLTIMRTTFDLWKEVDTAALDPHAPRALILEEEMSILSFLDLETGARELVMDGWQNPFLGNVLAVAPDFAGNRVLVTEMLEYEVPRRSGLYAIDLATGGRTVISDETTGVGVPLMLPFELAIDHEHGRAVVLDRLGDWDPPPGHVPAIMAIDLGTGDRTVLSGDGVGAGLELSNPTNLVLDPMGDIAYVLDAGHDVLLSVDLSTGARTVVASGPLIIGGETYPMRGNMQLDAANHRAMLLEDSGQLLAIDLATGAPTFVADLFSRDGRGDKGDIAGFMFDGQRDQAIFHAGDAFMRLDLMTGERQRISNAHVGAGPAMDQPLGVAVNGAGTRAYVAVLQPEGPHHGGVMLEVDLPSGNRRIVTVFDYWAGLEAYTPVPVILDEDNARLMIGDFFRGQVLTVALETGKRAILWDANAVFPDVNFVAVTDLALYDDDLLVAIRFDGGEDGELCALTLDSGVWRTLPGLGNLRELVISPDEGLAFVADAPGCSFAAIDLTTGTRHQFSDSSIPPGCYGARVLAHDHVRDRLVVHFGHGDEGEGFHVIDMATGDVTPIPVDYSIPSYNWQDLKLDPLGYSLLVADAILQALVAIDPYSGQMVVLSR